MKRSKKLFIGGEGGTLVSVSGKGILLEPYTPATDPWPMDIASTKRLIEYLQRATEGLRILRKRRQRLLKRQRARLTR